MGGITLHQGLIAHADGRFVADLEIGGAAVRALRLPQSAAAAAAGGRDLTGKIVFPGPVVVRRAAAAGGKEAAPPRHGPPATTIATVLRGGVAMAARPGPAPAAVDAVPVPLLADLERDLDALPEAVFSSGCAAFAAADGAFGRPLPGRQSEVLVRVLGHCGATLVVLSDRARTMEAGVGGLPLPLDGCRVLLAPAGASGMRRALTAARRSGGPGSGVAVAVPAHLLLGAGEAAAEWWREVRAGTVAAVSVGTGAGTQLPARLWWAGVATGRVTLEELAALLCGQPARLLGLPGKGRLYPGCDADLIVLDPEAELAGAVRDGRARGAAERPRGAVTLVLRGGADSGARPGRWIAATPAREPL